MRFGIDDEVKLWLYSKESDEVIPSDYNDNELIELNSFLSLSFKNYSESISFCTFFMYWQILFL